MCKTSVQKIWEQRETDIEGKVFYVHRLKDSMVQSCQVFQNISIDLMNFHQNSVVCVTMFRVIPFIKNIKGPKIASTSLKKRTCRTKHKDYF